MLTVVGDILVPVDFGDGDPERDPGEPGGCGWTLIVTLLVVAGILAGCVVIQLLNACV